jgi:hypothetical protein
VRHGFRRLESLQIVDEILVRSARCSNRGPVLRKAAEHRWLARRADLLESGLVDALIFPDWLKLRELGHDAALKAARRSASSIR